MVNKYLIIGSSAGGIGCALRLRMLDQQAAITVLTAEDSMPYNKCLLADVLLGERDAESTVFCSQHMLRDKNITLVVRAQVVSVDTAHKRVTCTDGSSFEYDKLCLAMGRSPRMVPLFADKKLNNLFSFYYKKNVDYLIEYVTTYKPRHAVVIGAGLTGLEAADGLRARGCTVTVIETAQHVLPNLVNAAGADVIHKHMQAVGVQLLTQELVTGYECKGDFITGLNTKNSGTIAVDLVVCAVGAEPNTAFLPDVIKRINGCCMVDNTLSTSVSDVYAVGDCCMAYDRLHKSMIPSNLWPDAMQQGMYAAYNMTGSEKLYPGTVQIAASGFFGIKVASAGPMQEDVASVIKEEQGQGWYHRFVYHQEKLIGFVLVGNTSDLATYRRQLMMHN